MRKIIRIIHVFGVLDYGGAETMVMNLYRVLDKTKYQFNFVVHGNKSGAYEDEIKDFGGTIYRVPKYKFWNHFFYKKKWKEIIKKYSPDIIHSHVRSTASIYFKEARKFSVKTIIHSHNTAFEPGIKGLIKRFTQRTLLDVSDVRVACSRSAGDWLFKDLSYTVIRNAIDTDKFKFNASIRKSYRNKMNIQKEFVVGHVGSLTTQKNHDFLLEIFSEILKKGIKAKLLIVGSGPLERQIEKKSIEKKVSEHMIHLKKRSDIPEIMCTMDVLVFPSLYEGLPLTLIEAQTNGLPIVMSDNITDELCITNLIIKKNLKDSPKEWAETIIQSKPRNRIGYFSELKNSDYDVEKNLDNLNNLYMNISERKLK